MGNYYVGLDVHSRESVFVVKRNDTVVARGAVPTTRSRPRAAPRRPRPPARDAGRARNGHVGVLRRPGARAARPAAASRRCLRGPAQGASPAAEKRWTRRGRAVRGAAARLLSSSSSALREAAPHLSEATGSLTRAIEGVRELGPALQPIVDRMAHGDSNKALDNILETSRSAKDVVQRLERILAPIHKIVEMFIEDRERERQADWRILFRNSAIAVLITSLALGIQIKAGAALNPLLPVRLIWLGLSVPFVLKSAHQVISAWREVAGSKLTGVARAEVMKAVWRRAERSLLWILVLVVANVFIQTLL
jgi:hypothetical protein